MTCDLCGHEHAGERFAFICIGCPCPGTREGYNELGKMPAHTPGPWKAKHRHRYASPTDDEYAGVGWDIEGPPEPMFRGQFEKAADAYLIAAAPDLLAACERLLECGEEWLECFVVDLSLDPDAIANDPDLNIARRAIAKAKGQAVPS